MKKWVYPITKVPSDFPYSNAFELLQYYRKEKRLSSETYGNVTVVRKRSLIWSLLLLLVFMV